jgi:hypothetical protein
MLAFIADHGEPLTVQHCKLIMKAIRRDASCPQSPVADDSDGQGIALVCAEGSKAFAGILDELLPLINDWRQAQV